MITIKSTIKAVLKKESGRTDYAVFIMLRTSHRLSPTERVTQKCYIRVGSYRLTVKQWNGREGLARSTYPYHVQLNQQIYLLKKQALDIVVRFEVEGVDFDAKKIKASMYPEGWEVDFFQFVEARILPNFESAGQVATAARYRVVLNKIEQCIGSRSIGIGSITPAFLARFDQYMTTLKNGANTRISNHKKVSACLTAAVKQGVIRVNPYEKYSLPNSTFVMREGLNIEELRRFVSVELPEGLITDVRNIWTFCFLSAGMRIGDALILKKSNISKGRIVYEMNKTDLRINIPVGDKLRGIVDSYINTSSKFLFPFMPNDIDELDKVAVLSAISSKTALINKYLSKIAVIASIETKLTTHIARHTAAKLLGDSGMAMNDISSVLGHDSLSTTEAYVATNNSPTIEVAAKILSGLLVD